MERFDEFLKTAAVKEKIPNPALARALLAKASLRLTRLSEEQVNAERAALVLEDSYEAIREAAQSLMELHGFKPYSHEALIAFLRAKQLLPPKDLSELDRFRVLRNKSVYEAKEFSAETGREALEFAKLCVPKIKLIFLKEVGEK